MCNLSSHTDNSGGTQIQVEVNIVCRHLKFHRSLLELSTPIKHDSLALWLALIIQSFHTWMSWWSGREPQARRKGRVLGWGEGGPVTTREAILAKSRSVGEPPCLRYRLLPAYICHSFPSPVVVIRTTVRRHFISREPSNTPRC